MTENPLEKLENYSKLSTSIFNKIFGDGYSEKIILPKGLALIVLYFIILAVMYFNGIYQNRKNLLNIITLTMILSILFQITIAFIGRFLGNDNEIIAAHEIIEKFYKEEGKKSENLSTLNSIMDNAMKTLNIYLIISFMFYNIHTITSFIVSYIKGEFIMSFNIYFPYIDQNTLYGYFFNMSILTIAGVLFWFLVGSRECHFIFYSMQVISMVNILRKKFENFDKKIKKLHEIVENQSGSSDQQFQSIIAKVISENRVKMKVATFEKEIIHLINEFEVLEQYKQHCFKYNKNVSFIALSANSIAIGLSLLYTRLVSIAIGLSLALLFFFQVLLYCLVGAIVSEQNEKLLQTVYDFPWYELSPKFGKIYMQFIHQCQNAISFDLPILGTLDLELFTNFIKASYSYMNYLFKFI
ncbi:hypothetical protein PVAND_014036 [Polypedilum vanderplanki]|uniref:Odorant receptor n=1 Tax=Polypedilum vanderplanki TaxID=319348 RepID=A0A9J6CSA8_POLVA|nr:hypothetical protein PVAND_014036 [Polypedilum vanderplanki]